MDWNPCSVSLVEGELCLIIPRRSHVWILVGWILGPAHGTGELTVRLTFPLHENCNGEGRLASLGVNQSTVMKKGGRHTWNRQKWQFIQFWYLLTFLFRELVLWYLAGNENHKFTISVILQVKDWMLSSSEWDQGKDVHSHYQSYSAWHWSPRQCSRVRKEKTLRYFLRTQ